jgi:hypothetical protein
MKILLKIINWIVYVVLSVLIYEQAGPATITLLWILIIKMEIKNQEYYKHLFALSDLLYKSIKNMNELLKFFDKNTKDEINKIKNIFKN